MLDIKEITKNRFPYDKIKLGHIGQLEYKVLSHNIDNLKNDIKSLVGRNKTLKRYKGNTTNYNWPIRRIFGKLSIENNRPGNLMKSLNLERKNRRFMSAIEIEKFRDHRAFLLKLRSLKDKKKETNSTNIYNTKKKYIALKKLKLSNKLKNSMTGIKINKEKSINKEFKTSFINQSTEDLSLIKDFTSNDNDKSPIRKRFDGRNKIKIKKKFSFFNSDNNNNKNQSVQNLKMKLNKFDNNEEQKNKKIFSGFNSNLNLNNNNSFITEEEYNMRKKIFLKNLEDKVDKYESSIKFLPNYDLINDYQKDTFYFAKEKNLNKIELKFLYKDKKIRKLFRKSNSTNKLILNKTLTPTRKNNYKLTSKSKDKNKNKKLIIKKLNIIDKEANKRKINMKTLYKKIDISNKVVDYFSVDEGKEINESMGNDLKNDLIKYNNELGDLLSIGRKYYLFSSHLPKIRLGQFNINNL